MTGPTAAPAVPEAVRDRELRRLDWRFLRPGLALERVDDPSPAALRGLSATECGVYLEWRRPVLGGGRALRARLASAGLEDVGLYWPCPSLRRPWFWLPLGSQAAAEYVRATRLPARSAVRRAVDRPLRALWRWAARHERLWPICAVARRSAAAPPSDELLPRIAREWATWELGGGRSVSPGCCSPAAPAPSARWSGWCSPSQTPCRGSSSSFPVRPKSAMRSAVRPRRLPPCTPARPAASGARLECSFATTGAVAGHWARPRSRAARSFLCSPLGRIGSSRSGRSTGWSSSRDRDRPVGQPAPERLSRRRSGISRRPLVRWWTPATSARPNFCSRPSPICRAFRSTATSRPGTCTWRRMAGLVVYDWESAEPAGLPLNDLVYFLAYLAFFHDQAVAPERCLETYRRARDPGTFTGAVHHDCIARYAEQIGLDSAHVRGLHLLTWLITRTRNMAASPQTPAALRPPLHSPGACSWGSGARSWIDEMAPRDPE